MQMRIVLAVLVVAACGKKGGDAPATGSAAATAPKLSLELVRCSTAPAPPAVSHGALGGGFGVSDVSLAPTKGDKLRILINSLHVLGSIEGALVHRELTKSVDAVQHCYDQLGKPKLEGIVHVELSIGSDGKVTAAKATGVDDKLDECTASAIQAIAFPAPKEGHVEVTVMYTFTYAVAGGFTAGGHPVSFGSQDSKRRKKPRPAPKPQSTADIARMTGVINSIDVSLSGKSPEQLPEQWTPFARVLPVVEAADNAQIDDGVAAAIKAKLADLDRCFAGNSAAGSLRAVIALGATAADTKVRAGGFGDATVERCVADALHALPFAPASHPHEVACDLARGGDQPWRVATAGYTVVHAAKAGAQVEGGTVAKDRIAVIVVDADAPGSAIVAAITAAADAPVALVALQDKGAPLVVAVAPGADRMFHSPLELSAADGKLKSCLKGIVLKTAPALIDATAVAAAITGAEKEWCKPAACAIDVVVGEQLGRAELVAIAAAARTAGVTLVGLTDQLECAR
jgi:hypothetical protein